MKSKFQKFKTADIKRSKIKKADYNPRKITEANKKRLRKAIKEHGLVMPIIWNEKTGNCVSGHQRLTVLDSIHKKKDYELTVAIINVDEKEEIKINVLLNNENLMGEFDGLMMAEIKDIAPDLDFKQDLGFEQFDLDVMFGGEYKETEDIEEAREYSQELANRKKEYNEKVASRSNKISIDDDNYTITLIFDNNEIKEEWCLKKGIDPKAIRARGHLDL